MKILLVNTNPFSFKAYPLGLLYIASVLEQEGHTVRLFDETYDINFSYAGYDTVMFTCMTTMLDHTLKVVDGIREKDKDIPIVFGGAHVTVLPWSVLQKKNPNDYVVLGEGEETIVELVNALLGKGDVFDVRGLMLYRDMILPTPARPPITNLDTIPFPARHLLNPKYFHGHRDNMICSRGCPFNCSFCQPTLQMIFGNKVRLRSPQNIRREVEQMQDNHDIRLIIFHDDTMTYDKKWMKTVATELGETGIRWECQSRVNTIDKPLVEVMKKGGCVAIRFGVESGSQEVLNGLRKGITVEQTRNAFKICHEVGMDTQAHIMVGNPKESRESVELTKKLISEIKPTRLYVTITTPMPMTDLWNDFKLGDTPWDKFNPSGQESLLKLENFTSDEIVKIRNSMMRNFWMKKALSPRFVYKTLRTHSFEESFETFKHLVGLG